MAREPVPHLEKKRNGPRSHGDRFKAKTPIFKSKEFTHD